MKRFFRFGLVALLCALAVPAVADDHSGRLRKLLTADEARAWQAVGRLNIGRSSFCTGALVAPDLVLTAAHCLFDPLTGRMVPSSEVEFLAGWRNGRASAYRGVRRAVVHPDYLYSDEVSSDRVRNDIALLELSQPIRNTTIKPFLTAARPHKGDRVGVVSYARDRSEAPSLQEVCQVLGLQEGVLVTSCSVDFGSSGAPIFTFADGDAHIVSVVSAKAEMSGQRVSLGTELGAPLEFLRAELDRGEGYYENVVPTASRLVVGTERRKTGAKFVKPKD